MHACRSTLEDPTCPDGYSVKNSIAVMGAGVTLTVEPGTVVKFDAGASLDVTPSAALVARGTADRKIRFTGWQAAPGSWGGIYVVSNNVSNAIVHAVIEYGGERERTGALSLNQESGQGGTLELTDTEIARNASNGIAIFHGSKLSKLERVTFKDNTKGAAHVEATTVSSLRGPGNVFESNGPDNVVTLETNIIRRVSEDTVWPSVAPAVYRVVGQLGKGGDLVYVDKHLVIEPGAVFEMAGGSGFLVGGGTSGLNAVGTPDKKIIFRGVGGSSWSGITYGESTWADNRLENAEVRNASRAPEWGYYGSFDDTVRTASILVGYNFKIATMLAVKDVLIAGPNGAPADIAKESEAVLDVAGVNAGAAADGGLEIEMF